MTLKTLLNGIDDKLEFQQITHSFANCLQNTEKKEFEIFWIQVALEQ